MNEVERFKQLREVTAERDWWRKRALGAISFAAALAFLILCFGIGQFFFN